MKLLRLIETVLSNKWHIVEFLSRGVDQHVAGSISEDMSLHIQRTRCVLYVGLHDSSSVIGVRGVRPH